jgi:hypothetical protein
LARWPLASDGSKKTNSKCQTIKEHVYAITEKPERVGEEAVESLDGHKSKIEAHEVKDPPRVLFYQDCMEKRPSFRKREQ